VVTRRHHAEWTARPRPAGRVHRLGREACRTAAQPRRTRAETSYALVPLVVLLGAEPPSLLPAALPLLLALLPLGAAAGLLLKLPLLDGLLKLLELLELLGGGLALKPP
jgi:hypothetical protein